MLIFLIVITTLLAGCGGRFTAPEGSIHSPHYPDNNYSNDSDCTWIIKTDPLHVVLLNFTDFNVQSSSAECEGGFVQVNHHVLYLCNFYFFAWFFFYISPFLDQFRFISLICPYCRCMMGKMLMPPCFCNTVEVLCHSQHWCSPQALLLLWGSRQMGRLHPRASLRHTKE